MSPVINAGLKESGYNNSGTVLKRNSAVEGYGAWQLRENKTGCRKAAGSSSMISDLTLVRGGDLAVAEVHHAGEVQRIALVVRHAADGAVAEHEEDAAAEGAAKADVPARAG